jgi:uncharacterized iron-regulated protein
MIDDSVANMVAIVLTALFLGLLNSFQYAEKVLPPDSLPQIRIPLSPSGNTGEEGPIVKPGTLITGALAPLSAWVSKLGKEHPLVGRVWSTASQETILPAEVVRAAAEADVVLIGETHDNPDHHKLQAWLLRQLAAKGKHPAVVMEMVAADKADDLANVQLASNVTADSIGSKLDWDNSGWPSFSIYRPIVDAALGANMTILPGDPAKDLVRQVSQQGLGALAYSERVRLGIGAQLPAALNSALTDELKASHCNQLPDADLASMVQVQRFRDAALADNVLKAIDKASGNGVVLIAGSGHVRSDRGVPLYLRTRASGLKVLTIALSEVMTGVENPEDGVPHDAAGKPAADFVWYTARSERPDPCGELQKQLQGKTVQPG